MATQQAEGHDAQTGSKRANDNDHQRPARSKRSRYVEIACDECKRRKVKCNGQLPCQRYSAHSVPCLYERHSRPAFEDCREFQRMHTQMQSMQDKIDSLVQKLDSTSARQENVLLLREPDDPVLAESLYPTESSQTADPTNQSQTESPPYRSPTSSDFTLDVAKGRLRAIGINAVMDNGRVVQDERIMGPVSQPATEYGPAMRSFLRDPLWDIEREEALRLCRVFSDGPGSMYPVLELEQLSAKVDTLFSLMESARRGRQKERTFLAAEASLSLETKILKLVLTTGMTLESGGTNTLGQHLFRSVEDTWESLLGESAGIRGIIFWVLVALYQFHLDEEVRASRVTCIAARLCLEIGLNRREILLRTFPNEVDRSLALRVFWSAYMLDRRPSIGLGVPFIMQDSDIDPFLPEPDSSNLYLRSMIEFTRLSGQAWRITNDLGRRGTEFKRDEIDYLDYQILKWQKQIPVAMSFHPSELELGRQDENSDSVPLHLRAILYARTNQLRSVIYRPALHSVSRISEKRRHAQTAVDIAKQSIQVLWNLNQSTEIVRAQPIFFKHFLVSAFGVLLLAVTNASAEFREQVRDEYYMALDLMKVLSSKYAALTRVWKSIRGLREFGPKLGLTPRQGAAAIDNHQTLSPGTSIPDMSAFAQAPGLGNLRPSSGVSQVRDEYANLFEHLEGPNYFFDFPPLADADGTNAYVQQSNGTANGGEVFLGSLGNDHDLSRFMRNLF